MKKSQRRQFIKNSLIAGIGSTLPGLAKSSAVAHTDSAGNSEYPRLAAAHPKKVIVAGAGISGLCCAFELMKAGHDVTVLEANGRHGGHVFTGRDGLSDGLYTDYGADHITRPGYEQFFRYVKELNLTAIPYPNAEGSQAAFDRHAMKMIGGKWFTYENLSDKTTLKGLGFNDREADFLSKHSWYEFDSLFLNRYANLIKDPAEPFVAGWEDLDKITLNELLKREGASVAALRFLGGEDSSALFSIWRSSSMKLRGIPRSEGETFHLKGGNQELPNAFARALGRRVLMNHRIQSIDNNESGVTVTYKAYGYDEEKQMKADLLVNCIPLPIFKNLRITPALPDSKQYVINNLRFSSHPFYTFEASSRFWLDDGLKSINMEFEHPDISSIWLENTDDQTGRIVLKAYGPGGLSPQRVLAAFRQLYPGKHDTIVQALSFDWTKDKYAPTCEMEPFPIGEMNRFWPEILKSAGKIYFAGTYADLLSRGMESCIRSAQRVASEINNLDH